MKEFLFLLPVAVLLVIILIVCWNKSKKKSLKRKEICPLGNDCQRIKLTLPASKCLECQGYQEGKKNGCCSACSQSIKGVNFGNSKHCFQHHLHNGHHCHSHHSTSKEVKQDYSLWLIFLIIGIVIAYISRLFFTRSHKRTGENK